MGYTASGFDGDGDESCILETLLLDCSVALETEMNEIVVLGDDVSSRTREVEGISFLDTCDISDFVLRGVYLQGNGVQT